MKRQNITRFWNFEEQNEETLPNIVTKAIKISLIFAILKSESRKYSSIFES